MSLVGETTFSKIGDLYCKCEWPPVEEGEMFLTLIHSDSAWTAILDKNSLDFGPRAADYEQVQHGIVKVGPILRALFIQDLIKTLKEAFSGESENYSIELNEEKLVWKKIQGKVKVKLAEIRLSRTSYSDAQTSFFTQLITENRILKKSNSELKIKEETLEKDNQLSHQMLVGQLLLYSLLNYNSSICRVREGEK